MPKLTSFLGYLFISD